MLSDNTKAYKTTVEYLNSQYFGDIDLFRSLLTEDVEMVHITNYNICRAIGIEEVFAIYKEKLFEANLYVDILYSNITAHPTKPKLQCRVINEKKDGDKSFKAEYIDDTTLTLDKDTFKIKRIDTETEKITIDLDLDAFTQALKDRRLL